MQFRKKPVIISAVRWAGTNLHEVLPFIQDGKEDFSHLPAPKDGAAPGIGLLPISGELVIPTHSGDQLAEIGDWIIRDIAGEFYPCKPDIFDATYEPVIIYLTHPF